MKKLIWSLSIFFAVIIFACSQEKTTDPVTGTWEGTLRFPGFDSRLVFTIEEDPDGRLDATLRKPDENENVIPVDQINYDGSLLQMKISSLKCTFSGRLNLQDSLIRGEWRHGIHLQPVHLKRITTLYEPDRSQ